jgi:hypothetical protein
VMFNIDSHKKMARTAKFIVFSIRIYNNFHYINRTRRKKNAIPYITVNFIHLFFGLLYSRVGAGAAGDAGPA